MNTNRLAMPVSGCPLRVLTMQFVTGLVRQTIESEYPLADPRAAIGHAVKAIVRGQDAAAAIYAGLFCARNDHQAKAAILENPCFFREPFVLVGSHPWH